MKTRKLGIMLITAVLLIALAFAGAASAEEKTVHVKAGYEENATHSPTLAGALAKTANDDAIILLDDDVTLNTALILAKDEYNVTIDGQDHKILLETPFTDWDTHNIYINLADLGDDNYVVMKDVTIDFNNITGDIFVVDTKNTAAKTIFSNVTVANIRTTLDGYTPLRSGVHLCGANVETENLQFKFLSEKTGQLENPHTFQQWFVSHIDLEAGAQAAHGTNLRTDMLVCGAYGKYPAEATTRSPTVYNLNGGPAIEPTFSGTLLSGNTIKIWSAFAWDRIHPVSSWDELANLVDSFTFVKELGSDNLTIGDTIQLTADFTASGAKKTIEIPRFVTFDSYDNAGTHHVITLPSGYNISVMTPLGLSGVLGPNYDTVTGAGLVVTGTIIDIANYAYLSSGITIQNDNSNGLMTITVPDEGTFHVSANVAFESSPFEVNVPAGKTISLYGKNADIALTDGTLKVDGTLNLYTAVNGWSSSGVSGSGTINFYERPTTQLPKTSGVTFKFAPFKVNENGKMAAGELYKDEELIANPYSLIFENGTDWTLQPDHTNLTINGNNYTVKDNTDTELFWSVDDTGKILNARILDVSSIAKKFYYVDEGRSSSSYPYYKNLSDAINATEESPDTEAVIQLDSDITLNSTIVIGKTSANLTIDGQGHKIRLIEYIPRTGQTFKFSDDAKHVIVFEMTDRAAGTSIVLKDVAIDLSRDDKQSYPGDIIITNNGTVADQTMYLTNVTIANINTLESPVRSGLHISGTNVVADNLRFGFTDIFGFVTEFDLPYLDPFTPLQMVVSAIDLSPFEDTNLQAKLLINDMPFGAVALYPNSKESIAPVVTENRFGEKLEPISLKFYITAQTLSIYPGFGEGVYYVKNWDELKTLTTTPTKLQEGDIIKVLADIKSPGNGDNIDIPAGVVIDPTVVISFINRNIELNEGDSLTVHDVNGLRSLFGPLGLLNGIRDSCTKGSGKIILADDFANIKEIEDFVFIPPQTTIQIGKEVDGKTPINIVLPNSSVETDNTLTIHCNWILPMFKVYPNSTITITDNVDGAGNNAAKLRIVNSPLIPSEENGLRSLDIYGTATIEVPVIEWPTFGVSGDGKGVLNIYEKSAELPMIYNVTVNYAPLLQTGIGRILKDGELADLDTLYENGTSWSVEGTNLTIGEDTYTLESPTETPGYWNVETPSGNVTNARTLEAVFTAKGTYVSFDYNGVEEKPVIDTFYSLYEPVSDKIPSISKEGYVCYWNEIDGGNITDSKFIDMFGLWSYDGEKSTLNFYGKKEPIVSKQVADDTGIVEFGKTNTTVLNDKQDTVSHVVLDEVTGVSEGTEVVFTSINTTEVTDIPVSDEGNYSKVQDISIFEVDAITTGDSSITVTMTFKSWYAATMSAPLIRFWHYDTSANKWELLSSEYIQIGAKVIFTADTTGFSPIGISLEKIKEKPTPSPTTTPIPTPIPTPTPTPHVPSSGGDNGGSTKILTSTPVATSMPTQNPSSTPTVTPVNPTTQPTQQQTQKSPAPFVGLIAGLGAALVLARLRK